MKKKSLYVLASLLYINSIFAQKELCDCKADLNFIVEKLRKMPSYKKQIKGEKLNKFNATYNEILTQTNQFIDVENCYKLLLKQMNLINDGHASLQINNNYKKLNVGNINENKESKKITDSIYNDLKNKPEESIEGLYTINNEIIGVYYKKNSKNLLGTVLKTDSDNWSIGETRFVLTLLNTNKYNMYHYGYDSRKPRFSKSISIDNGRILSYKKINNSNNYELPLDKSKVADFKILNDNTQYLYFSTFSNSKKKELKSFFNVTKNKLTADNIIVDLRSNTGGNSKLSDGYLKLLKNKNVYILTNSFTASNAEQFTLKLLKNKKARHLGQKTFGIVSYGINYGYNYNTPSGYFNITPTDMNFHQYIEFESKGISPQINLDFNSDWIEQTLKIINSDEN